LLHFHKANSCEAKDADFTVKSALLNLSTFPLNILETALPKEEESQNAIAEAVSAAMQRRDIHIYALHEMSGLSTDIIEAILSGKIDLSDSQVLQILEQTLSVKLSDL